MRRWLKMSSVEVTNGIKDLLLLFMDATTTPNGTIKGFRCFYSQFFMFKNIYILLKMVLLQVTNDKYFRHSNLP